MQWLASSWGAAVAEGLHNLGFWLFWPSLWLALSSAWGYMRKA